MNSEKEGKRRKKKEKEGKRRKKKEKTRERRKKKEKEGKRRKKKEKEGKRRKKQEKKKEKTREKEGKRRKKKEKEGKRMKKKEKTRERRKKQEKAPGFQCRENYIVSPRRKLGGPCLDPGHGRDHGHDPKWLKSSVNQLLFPSNMRERIFKKCLRMLVLKTSKVILNYLEECRESLQLCATMFSSNPYNTNINVV